MPKFSHSFKILYLFLFSWLLFACSHEEFSEEKPYAVILSQFRTMQEAENMQSRLKDMGLYSYIFVEENTESGSWFKLFAGAEDRLEKMMARKIDYENAYGFKELTIVNFNKIAPQLNPYRNYNSRKINTKLAPPSLQKSALGLKLAPYITDYHIGRLAFYLPTEEISMKQIPLLRKDPMDLPRGISPLDIEQKAESVIEVIYEDPIRGDHYILHVIKVNKVQAAGENLIQSFGDKIINTREYPFEEVLAEEVDAEMTLTGVLVNLMVKQDEYRRYILVTDPKKEYLFFLQASSNNLANMRSLLEAIGQRNGLSDYPSIHTLFNLLPAKKTMPDELAFFKYNRISPNGNYSNPLVWGLSEADYQFYNNEKGLWQTKIMLFEQDSSAQLIFDEWYDHKRIKKEETSILGQRALFAYSRRKRPDSRSYTDVINELQFCRGPYIVAFSNNNRAWLTGAELIDKALQFRFDELRGIAKK